MRPDVRGQTPGLVFRVEGRISDGGATVAGRLKIERREHDLSQVAIEFRAKSDVAAYSWSAAP